MLIIWEQVWEWFVSFESIDIVDNVLKTWTLCISVESAPPLRAHTLILAASSTVIVGDSLGIVRWSQIVLAVLSIHVRCLLHCYCLWRGLVKVCNRWLRLDVYLSLSVLAARMILGYDLLLLLFLHVDWLCNHVSVIDWLNLLIVFHK